MKYERMLDYFRQKPTDLEQVVVDPFKTGVERFAEYIDKGEIGDEAQLILWGKNKMLGKIVSRKHRERREYFPAYDVVTVEIYPKVGKPVQRLDFYTFEDFTRDNHQIEPNIVGNNNG